MISGESLKISQKSNKPINIHRAHNNNQLYWLSDMKTTKTTC